MKLFRCSPIHRYANFLLPWSLCISAIFCQRAGADWSFVHVTDTHVGADDKPGSNAAIEAQLYGEINALQPKPAFAINTGDTCEVGTPEEYRIYRKSVEALSVPMHAAPGNHDVRWNPLGKEGYEKGSAQPLFQSWDYQNLHFVLLDSTVLLQHWGHFDQSVLQWLRADLQRVGREKPVIIGFHHWIGRDEVQVDNERQLLAVTAPYNIVLWLQGHGHSDIQWNIQGAPAIMAKGLYQGSYHLIEVSDTRLRVLRRTAENSAPTEVLAVPLVRARAPWWSAHANIEGDQLIVEAERGELLADSRLQFRVDGGKYEPLPESFATARAHKALSDMVPGEHMVTVRATLPDGRAFVQTALFSLRRKGFPSPMWVTPLGGAVQSKLVRSGDKLFVTTMSGELVCLDADNGSIRWRFATGGALFSTPLVNGQSVYFGSADHNIYAVNAATGTLRWKAPTGGAVFAGAALAKGVLCFASVDTKIYGLDAATGKYLWTAQGAGMYQSQATTDGERFFVGGWDNFFRALDVASGREVWRQKFGRAFYFAPAIGSPTVGDGKVFVTSNDGVLHAMEATSGKVLWEVSGPSLGYSGPLFHDGTIYNASLTGNGRVFAFDATNGQPRWERETGSVIYDSSCAWGQVGGIGAVYVGCVNGTFSAIRADNGHLLWQYHLAPGHLLASPTTNEKCVFIASQNGTVVALPLNTP